MILGSYIPGEVIATVYGALVGIVMAIGVTLSRTRERLAKVEEWQRLHDLAQNRDSPEDSDGGLTP